MSGKQDALSTMAKITQLKGKTVLVDGPTAALFQRQAYILDEPIATSSNSKVKKCKGQAEKAVKDTQEQDVAEVEKPARKKAASRTRTKATPKLTNKSKGKYMENKSKDEIKETARGVKEAGGEDTEMMDVDDTTAEMVKTATNNSIPGMVAAASRSVVASAASGVTHLLTPTEGKTHLGWTFSNGAWYPPTGTDDGELWGCSKEWGKRYAKSNFYINPKTNLRYATCISCQMGTKKEWKPPVPKWLKK